MPPVLLLHWSARVDALSSDFSYGISSHVKNLLRKKGFVPAALMSALPAVLLVLIGYTGSFTRYIADDYCSAFWAERFGLFRSVWHWYLTWSGRFSAYASDWFVTVMGARNVGLIPPIMLSIWLALTATAVYLFLRGKQKEAGSWWTSLGLGIVFVFAVLTIMPSIETSFYWWNGMRSYTLPLMFLTLFAVVYQVWIGKLQGGRWLALACLLSLVFFFANAGLGDVYAVTQLGLLSILALLSLRSYGENRAPLAVLSAGVLGTLLALAVILTSPGNPIREGPDALHPGVIRLLAIAWQGYAGLIQGVVVEPRKLLALGGGILASGWAGLNTRIRGVPRWAAVAIIAAGVLLSYGALLPGSWGLSEPPPPRNISVPTFALTASLFIAAFISGAQLSTRATPALAWTVAAIAMLSLNVAAGIGIQKAATSTDIYIRYAQSWDAEEAHILQAKATGAASVTVPAWPNWAGLNVLSEHPQNWLNQCASGYYGIEVIGQEP